MPIRLECPNPDCKVKLAVKEHLAGKRVPCPKCKQPLLIPAPVDVEALAAAALGDEPQAEQNGSATIDFTCPFCDEEVHVPRELGGKQAPCPNPECRRIIKVPMPKDERPDDWRNLKRTGPSGARENVEAPRLDGAWDTSRSTVSGEALVEAGAVKEEKPPVTPAQWARRGAFAAVAVVVLVVGVVGARWYFASSRLQSLLEQALSYADAGSNLAPERKGAIERLAGEYYLEVKQPDNAKRALMRARAHFSAVTSAGERDAGLREVALTQTRLKTDRLQDDLRKTLDLMLDGEAKLIALRDILGRLLTDNRKDVAVPLGLTYGSVATPPPAVGGKGDPDEEPGDGVPKAQPPAGENKPAGPPPAVSPLASQRIAVDLAVDPSRKASAVKDYPADLKTAPDPVARQGYAEGLARQDRYEKAVELANAPGEPVDRLRTWLALADIAAEAGKTDQAGRYAGEALKVFEGELKRAKVSPWLAWQLARALARGGNEAKAKELADAVPDPAVKGRAQLELFVQKGNPADLDAAVSDHQSLEYALGLAFVIRRAGAPGEEPRELSEEVRPFVLLGEALKLKAQEPKR